MESLVPISLARCSVTKTGMTFESDITFGEWLHTGNQLCHARDCVSWLIGDWVNFGKRHQVWGDKARAAIEIGSLAKLSAAHVENIASVCNALSVRNENLDFTHHVIVAKLTADSQRKFLALAEENDWTVADLREAVKLGESTIAEKSKPIRTFLGWVGEGIRLISQRKKEIATWDAEMKQNVKEELKPLVEFYATL